MVKTYIKPEGGKPIPVKGIYAGQRSMRGGLRNSLEIRLSGEYELIRDLFTDGLHFSVLQENPEGEVFSEEFDKEAFCVAGDIVDHRNGNFTVYMGEKTAEELLLEENAALLYKMLTGEEFE